MGGGRDKEAMEGLVGRRGQREGSGALATYSIGGMNEPHILEEQADEGEGGARGEGREGGAG